MYFIIMFLVLKVCESHYSPGDFGQWMYQNQMVSDGIKWNKVDCHVLETSLYQEWTCKLSLGNLGSRIESSMIKNSKPSKLGWRFNGDSDFNVEIPFQLKVDATIKLNSTNFRLKLMDFDGFWWILIYFCLKDQSLKCQLKDQKS